MEQHKIKSFISHASEDKERFVRNFATKLREKGIDVWYDEWEMLPGDSLVDKIFEEGLKDAIAFIIVISVNSIEKPWVREELNSAFVNRIENKVRIIPVIIDEGVQVPEVLKSTIWQRINNLNSYEAELDRIVIAINGKKDKPIKVNPPKYLTTVIDRISDLSDLDNLIFKTLCDIALKQNNLLVYLANGIPQEIFDLEIPIIEIEESIELLHHREYLKRSMTNVGISHVVISNWGFHEYAKIFINDYSDLINSVAYEIINSQGGMTNNFKIIESLKFPKLIVDHIIELLYNKSLIDKRNMTSGYIMVSNFNPELKRRFST